MRAVDAVDPLFLALCFLPKPSNFWPNLSYRLSSYESTEVVTPSAHYNMTYWNQNSPSNAWNARSLCLMPLVTASGCSLLLHSLWTQSVSLKKKFCIVWSTVKFRFNSSAFEGCCDSPATTNVTLNITERHLRSLPASWSSAHYCTSYWNTAQERDDKWKWYCVYGWPRPSCDFQLSALMWSGQCGFRGQTGATVRLVRDLFPSRSQQDVFNEPQCVWTVASRRTAVQPSSLACTTWKGRRKWNKKQEDVSNPGNAVSETKTTNQTLAIIEGNVFG